MPLPAKVRFSGSNSTPILLTKAARWCCLLLYFSGLVAWVTWPQARDLHLVNDFGDPLLNSWALAWVGHALQRSPLHLFDANIFFPESGTLAYSESLIVPGAIVAPLLWLGLDPIVVHNLLVLGGYVFSGLAMFVLADDLVKDAGAALIAATIFAIYPYRTETYGHVQLQLVFWLPLALFWLHRLVREPRWRYGAYAGLALALQAYTCVYYAVYGSVLLAIVSVGLLVGARQRRRVSAGLLIALSIAGIGSLPLGLAYRRASRVVGERTAQDLATFSAHLSDYHQAHPANWLYGSNDRPGAPEKRLFPGYSNLGLALAGSLTTSGGVVAAYVAGAITSVNLSLGVNGVGYTWLYDHVAPFRALRVPARFGMVLGLALAVLAAFGSARLLRGRAPAVRVAIVCVLLGSVTLESRNRSLDLSALPDLHPAVYDWLAGQPPGVVCEYPVGNLEGRIGPQDPTYEDYSTRHWKPLVNGYSGFEPPSYLELKARLSDFPSEQSLSYLRQRKVEYLLVHQGFYLSARVLLRYRSASTLSRSPMDRVVPLARRNRERRIQNSSMIDPHDVIRRYSVEELIETADQYFSRVDDATPLMLKPFSFLDETPEMLHNLGLLLGGLRLGRTMKVLDFGAGTCWLSRILIQLNCQAISCDVSAAALDIGKRLFRELPPIGTVAYQPQFLIFDGHHIDLPNESVDRIICFDAFHHVPNQDEVLAEFGRVLRSGGIAGFSEPGRSHSRSPQSQYEMFNHRVLENDIDVNGIFARAQAAGFTRLSLQVALDMEMSLPEHNILFAPPHGGDHESVKAELWNQTHNTMTNRAIFFLHKGTARRDSRSHQGLAHTLTATNTRYAGVAGHPIEMSFVLSNTGDAIWLATNDEIFGIVRLGAHLYDAHGKLLSVDFFRHDLAADVVPGQRLELTVPVTFESPGTYTLLFDLVAEGVTWFENVGSKPASVVVSVK